LQNNGLTKWIGLASKLVLDVPCIIKFVVFVGDDDDGNLFQFTTGNILVAATKWNCAKNRMRL
jgi:hypothetical protein